MTTTTSRDGGLSEYSTPSNWNEEPAAGIAEVLWEQAAEHPNRPTFAYRDGNEFVPVKLSEVKDHVVRLAKGLIATGIDRGDRVCLFSPTRIEYTYVDLALWAVGAVAVTIYETSSAEQVERIVADSGAKAIFIDGSERHGVFRIETVIVTHGGF